VLEAENFNDYGGTDVGNMRVDVKPLANIQTHDQLFQEYGRLNREKIRECYRLPPIFIGRSDDYNRSTAESSRRLADEQIFKPERDDVDLMYNTLLTEFDMAYHDFKSNGPNITDDEDLIKLMLAAEKVGAMSPEEGRIIYADIMGKEPNENWPEGIDPKVPMILQMAEAVKNKAQPSEPGQQVTAIKSTLQKIQGLDDLEVDKWKILKKESPKEP
jgi:capsid portal protein